MYVSAKPQKLKLNWFLNIANLCFNFLFFISSQNGAYALVSFSHKTHLVRVR